MPELSATAQHWVIVVLIWVGFGSLAGLAARIVLPTREPAGLLPNLTFGIAGSAVGLAVLSWWMRDTPLNPISPLGFLAAAAGALCLLVLYRVLHAVVPHWQEKPATTPGTHDSGNGAEEDSDEGE
jgi:uncharacterized membrane protein YeaQ/YmgE (transglycosylase-associated protein family)